jgi:hypothetical protein
MQLLIIDVSFPFFTLYTPPHFNCLLYSKKEASQQRDQIYKEIREYAEKYVERKVAGQRSEGGEK